MHIEEKLSYLKQNILTIGALSTKYQDMYLPRIITQRLTQLAQSFPAIIITGARQVGKSTLVQNVFENRYDYVVFDPTIDVENARYDPELFLNNHRLPLILDEIQYAPELIAAIKRRIDQNRSPGQYILTGSQQWGVLKPLLKVWLDAQSFLTWKDSV